MRLRRRAFGAELTSHSADPVIQPRSEPTTRARHRRPQGHGRDVQTCSEPQKSLLNQLLPAYAAADGAVAQRSA